MIVHKFKSFKEAAELFDCSLEDVRRWVTEDRGVPVVLVCLRGSEAPFRVEPLGLRTYDVSDTGEVVYLPSRQVVGNLRITSEAWAAVIPETGSVTPQAVPESEKKESPRERRLKVLAVVEEEEKNSAWGAQARAARRLGLDPSMLSKDLKLARARPKSGVFEGLLPRSR